MKNKDKKYFTLYNANLRTKTIVVISVALILFLIIILSSIFVDKTTALATNFTNINQPPSLEYPFGTDGT